MGDYEHPAYGVVAVTRPAAPAAPARPAKSKAPSPPTLAAGFHGIAMALDHWHFETWKATPSDPALSESTLFVQFHANVRGDVDRLTMNLEPNAGEIVLREEAARPPVRPRLPAGPDRRLRDGDNPTFTMTIDLKGAGLTAFVPGQPTYDLVPTRGTEFRLKQVTGFGIRFVLDEKGAVKEALLLQPDAVYTIRRK